MHLRWIHRTVGLVCLLAAAATFGGARVPPERGTALDRYVAAPDPSYHFELVKSIDAKGYRAFVLDLTSQTWLTTKEVDRPVWKHWLTIIEPSEVRTSTGLLLIGGGNNCQPAPQKVDQTTAAIAVATGSVVAELQDVPNQPLTFVGDGEPRVEDGIIAYTWERFLQTGDEKWPARLPMTKAAVRAMDAVTSFCESDDGGHAKVDRFVVAGASKRGWTTWTTAAVDDRVIGIVPIVIDTLNTGKTSAHHFAAYGFWSSALKDYQDMKLDRWAGTKQYQELLQIEDPYSYRARFTMPKLVVNSTGDQYFLPDNSQFYFGDLPGPKYLRYVPNTDHSLRNSDARQTVLAFYSHLVRNNPLPRLSWTLEQDGSIRAVAMDQPTGAKLWQATNPTARDFRLETLGPKWTSTPLRDDGHGAYVASVKAPAKGWTAFFIEFMYTGAAEQSLKLTTQVRVLPEGLPFAAAAAGLASGKASESSPGIPPVSTFGQPTAHISIEELRRVRLPDVTLEKVESVNAGAQKNPRAMAHVQVQGVIGGHIRFELVLPDNWNGRFVMGGGGGFVGSVQNAARDSVNLGYATVGTDTGHESEPGYLAGWARDNVEAQLNFGYLAVHRTAEVAKALTRAYYGADPAYCYFVGCSRGGGQAMMESQRYPKDFDGIVAGAPAFNWTGLAAMSVSIAKALYPDPAHLDHTVLDKEALQKLRQGILEQCDEQDGLKDGIIADPPSAHFDLSKVSGLTDEQRRAIAAIYRGARNGQAVIYPGYSPPAECDPDQWVAWIVGPVPPLVARDHVPDLIFAFGTQIWKYLVFNQPDWDYSTYDFANYARDTRLAASFLNATNPDLDSFKARKGKLILWHGWADPALPAQATVDYYRQVWAHDPGAAEYCRLFMVPGCLHCGGGPGASEVDWLSTIVDWVEQGKAPDRLVASKRENGKLVMTRPLYPYPEYPVYKGSGDPSKADSFKEKNSMESQ